MMTWLEKLAARYNYELTKRKRVDREIAALAQRFGSIDSTREIVFVGTLDQPGFRKTHKMSPDFYLPIACDTASAMGVKIRLVPDPRALPGLLRRLSRPLFVLVYNEQTSDQAALEDVVFLLERCFPEAPIANHPARCLALGDKKELHALYTANGIAMPARVTESVAGHAVFSNETASSGASTRVLQVGEALDDGRYNTVFVDTAQCVDGVDYYVSLRALAVGGECLAAYARARPVAQGDASVHAKDTPPEPALLNQLHAQVVLPRLAEIRAICGKIGDILGLGCFAHDLLPDNHSQRLLVCESGLKFNDGAIRRQMAGLAAQTPMFAQSFSGEESRLSAEALIRQAEQAGWLP